jgi:hypothetical protein
MDDLADLAVTVGKLEEGQKNISQSILEMRAEMRLMSDSISACSLPALCREHEERGKEFDKMKITVDRHDVTLGTLSKLSWVAIGSALTAIFAALR